MAKIRSQPTGRRKAARPRREYGATLRIYGRIPDRAAITRQLGIAPTHTHQKGEPWRPGSRLIHTNDMWQVKAKVRPQRSLEYHVEWLYQRLTKRTPVLRKLVRKHTVDLYCQYLSNYDQGGITLPPHVLAWCGELGIPVHVSIPHFSQ